MAVDKLIDKAPEIIREAARSPLGLLALVVLLLSLLALIFFHDASEQIRLVIFVLILVAAAFFAAKVLQIASSASKNTQEREQHRATPAVTETKAGKEESNATVRLVAISREFLSTSSVDAVVVEEDTSLVMSAETGFKDVKESHERLIGQAQFQKLEAPGAVVVKDGSPLQFLAIVHDLEKDPSWREDWVEKALQNIFQEAEKRKLRSIALPMLATLHGKLTKHRFSKLLTACLERIPLAHLQTIWLVVPADTDRSVFENLGVFEFEIKF